MDSSPKHIIGRQILEIRGLKEADAQEVQKTFGGLYRGKIISLLDQFFTKLSPGEDRIRVDRIELDLGRIVQNTLEENWEQAITKQLEEQLQPFISENQTRKASDDHSQLELVQYFVETGSLPWWADSSQSNLLDENIDYLLEYQETLLRSKMHDWVQNPNTLTRIIRQLGFSKWLDLAALNMDIQGTELRDLLIQLRSLLRSSAPWNNYSDHKLTELLGLQLLPWVYLSSGKVIDSPEFWKGFLLQLASSHRLKYDQVLKELYHQLEGDKELKIGRRLAAHLRYLVKEQGQKPSNNLQQELIKRLKQQLNNQEISRTLKFRLLQILEQIESRELSGKDWEVVSKLLEQIQHQKKMETTPDHFNDTDELFIGNAGLVILWPFLTRFFENLDLVAEQRFVNETAAHRAVGLLQFLTDGQELPAEYHCGLNKIMCGMDWNEVLDFGEPVTADEAAACDTLLQAVIANAPILGEMSTEGFRGTFLLRNGMLRAGTGIWQLHVERQAYDIVLERFPWSWGIVKLPWMEIGIGVEW